VSAASGGDPATPYGGHTGLRVYGHPRVIAMAFLGFSAGLPLLLVGGTFTAWLQDMGVGLAAIGFLSWVGTAHSVKVLWAPFVDRLTLPGLGTLMGRRRSWMLLAQAVVGSALLGMALTDPADHLGLVAVFAIAAGLGSATQDVAIDAYRVEAVDQHYQAAMAATYVLGYRIALLTAGAGALHLASLGDWGVAYGGMALLMGVGLLTTLIIREPTTSASGGTERQEARVAAYLARTGHQGLRRRTTAWLIGAVVCPFADFFRRFGLPVALLILLFVATFRISDLVMGVMANPFYLDLGFTKEQIANVAAAFGLAMTLLGAGVGGVLVSRLGLAPMLIATAVLAPLTNLTFSGLAALGPQLPGLVAAIVADNVTGGMSIAVFLAYLASLTNTAYTATQYALFSSLMTLPGQLLGGLTGVVAEQVGWIAFFGIAAAAGLPALLLALALLRVAHPDRAGTGRDVETPRQKR